MYAKITNGNVEQYPYTLGNLRRDNSAVSFPKTIPEETLNQYNVFKVEKIDRPSINELVEFVSEVNPINANSKWVQQFVVTQYTQEQAVQNVKLHRNNLLAASDWTQVADAPVDKAAWATYRQALRDVPGQEGFPWDITWPEVPGNAD